MTTRALTPEEYLSIPYVLIVDSVQRADGEWVRRAEYPEIGCACEGATPLEAMDGLEEARVRFIVERLERGATDEIPVPRPPLRSSASSLDLERLGFARWLVDQQRVSDHASGADQSAMPSESE